VSEGLFPGLNPADSKIQKPQDYNHRGFENYRDIVLVLLQKEIKVRYKNKILGYVWSVANPLAHAFVYVFAFDIMMRMRAEDYVLSLLTALFAWQWMTNSFNSTKLFVGNALIRKINFPKIVIPVTAILNHMIHFLLSIPVILIFLLIDHRTPHLSWLWIFPILLVIQTIMTLGVSLFFASLNPFLRDLERLVGIMTHFAFFLTPILYTVDNIPDEYKPFIVYHPLAPLILSWRSMFMDGTYNPAYLVSAFISSLIIFALGYFVFRKLSWKFAEV
jgi:lipopolysaccharide transport system permease protein